MNDFSVHDASAETVLPVPVIVAAAEAAPAARQVPVEDLGLGIVRLVKDGVAGAAALGKGDGLSVAAKKATGQFTDGVNQLMQKATDLVGRCRQSKE